MIDSKEKLKRWIEDKRKSPAYIESFLWQEKIVEERQEKIRKHGIKNSYIFCNKI